MTEELKTSIKKFLPVIPALIAYAVLANHLNFIQDDAYITYRYVANFLNGDGLVWNIGERIEGFTNFGWTIFLILWGALGADYILISKITGFLFGAGIIVLTYLLAQMALGEKSRWFVFLPVYLVGVNLSLAYWSPAGLETAGFAFMAMLSLYLYLRRSWFLIVSLALAVWIRPEGAVITGVLIVVEAVMTRKVPWFSLRCALAALAISIPFVAFKILYYGSIFPNPFFAKTGLHFDQLSNGIEYAGRFFRHYGFYGVGFVIPLIFFKKLSATARTVWWFTILYTLYIVLIGGDVLKVHRFFIPIFGTAALLAALSLWHLVARQTRKTQYLALFVIGPPLLLLTFYAPKKFVFDYNLLEKRFVIKMRKMAERIEASDPTDFSVALSTIGRFSYHLIGHDIIDMVGLTDSTIARHSEEPIEGMETTWKEQKHSSKYLLGRAPDYILFSTGIKPSAPAERALYLYRQFVDAYRTVGWYFRIEDKDRSGLVFAVFKRMRDVEGEIVPYYPVEYVQLYKLGLDEYVKGNYPEAIKYFNQSLRASIKPYNPAVIYQKAFCHMMLQQHEVALQLMNNVVGQDSLVFQAHRDLYMYAQLVDDTAKAETHKRWLQQLVPWYWPQIKAYVDQQVRASRERRTGAQR